VFSIIKFKIMSKEIDKFMPHAGEEELREVAFKLENLLRNLLSQANEVHRYSSWVAMCEENNSTDARGPAMKYLIGSL